MSTKTLPILFLNLGGEMLYILDQRLRAQSIPQEKAQKGEKLRKEISLRVHFLCKYNLFVLAPLIVPFVYQCMESICPLFMNFYFIPFV